MLNENKFYKYSPLANPAHEIRLVDLLPGSFKDDIRLLLINVIVEQQGKERYFRMGLKELTSSLPPG
jgi:hypothetical protein